MRSEERDHKSQMEVSPDSKCALVAEFSETNFIQISQF